jgi:hypothetical protein
MFSQVKKSKESNERLKEKVCQQDRDLHLAKDANSKKDKELYSLRQEKFKMFLKEQRSEKMKERYEKIIAGKEEIISKVKEEKEEITSKLK